MWRKIFLVVCVIGVIMFFSYKIISAINKKEQQQNSIAAFPDFKFFTQQNQPFTKDSLTANKSTLFLYFNTSCEHCQYETEQIIKNITSLSNANVLFISRQSAKEIQAFDSIYHLTNYSSIKLLHDSTDNFYKTFGTGIVPSSVIYDAQGKFVKIFKGEVKIEAIIALLK